VTKSALIVFDAVYYSAVVSPGGPSKAVLSCTQMPDHDPTDTSIKGPAGVLPILYLVFATPPLQYFVDAKVFS